MSAPQTEWVGPGQAVHTEEQNFLFSSHYRLCLEAEQEEHIGSGCPVHCQQRGCVLGAHLPPQAAGSPQADLGSSPDGEGLEAEPEGYNYAAPADATGPLGNCRKKVLQLHHLQAGRLRLRGSPSPHLCWLML